MALNMYLSIIILYVNAFNAQIKRYKVAEWIRKQGSYICCFQDTHLRLKDTERPKAKGWKN